MHKKRKIKRKKFFKKILKNGLFLILFLILIIATGYFLPEVLHIMNMHFGVEHGSNMLSLYVAVLSLEATVLIALLVYYWQKKNEDKEEKTREENAKRILGVEVAAAVEHMARFPGIYDAADLNGNIYDICMNYLPDVQKILDTQQLHHLLKVMNLLRDASKKSIAEDDYSAVELMKAQIAVIVKPWVYRVANSDFAGSLASVKDYKSLLNEETLSLLMALLDEKYAVKVSQEYVKIKSAKDMLLFDVKENDSICIYDDMGNLRCEGKLVESEIENKYVIENGWVRLDKYIGEVRNQKYNGQGCTYDSYKGHKLEEGIWEDGELIIGTEYDVVVEKIGEKQYERYGSYWKHRYTMDVFQLLEGDFYVTNYKVTKTTCRFGKMKSIKEFLKQHDTWKYDLMKKYS